jgi:AcrR family transcriptional regulator
MDDLPLRERKKALARQAILDTAERLFEQRGYDNVTVAEIADAANVSVKTLFVYFRSKEELAFADTWLIDGILDALRDRDAGATPAQAVAQMLIDAISEADEQLGVEAYHRGYGGAASLQSAALRFWARYEDLVTAALAAEGEAAPTPAHRFLAIQLVGIPKMATAPEMRDALAGLSQPRAAARLESFFREAAAAIDG